MSGGRSELKLEGGDKTQGDAESAAEAEVFQRLAPNDLRLALGPAFVSADTFAGGNGQFQVQPILGPKPERFRFQVDAAGADVGSRGSKDAAALAFGPAAFDRQGDRESTMTPTLDEVPL
jgi:hypothetical protein